MTEDKLSDVLCLADQTFPLDGTVTQIPPFELDTQRAMRVGDAVDGAVLFDGSGGALPRRAVLGVVGHGAESVGEVVGGVVCDGVAAGAGIDAENEIEFSFTRSK